MKSTINIEKKYSPLIDKLVFAIREFYPTGINNFNSEYNRYDLIVKTVTSKIDQLENNALPERFYKLLDNITLSFKDKVIFNQSYHEFPNYSLTIELDDRLADNIQCISLLHLRISLLTNHYTIFFEEVNSYNDFPEDERRDRPVSFRIYSSRNYRIDPEKMLLKELCEMVEESFHEYEFINHKILFDVEIDSLEPFRLTGYNLKSYPIYAFLFDNNYYLPPYWVIE